jgi:hypothetical protein
VRRPRPPDASVGGAPLCNTSDDALVLPSRERLAVEVEPHAKAAERLRDEPGGGAGVPVSAVSAASGASTRVSATAAPGASTPPF